MKLYYSNLDIETKAKALSFSLSEHLLTVIEYCIMKMIFLFLFLFLFLHSIESALHTQFETATYLSSSDLHVTVYSHYKHQTTLTWAPVDINSDNCSTPAAGIYLAVYVSLEASSVEGGNSLSLPEWNTVSSLAWLMSPKDTSDSYLIHLYRDGGRLGPSRWTATPGLFQSVTQTSGS